MDKIPDTAARRARTGAGPLMETRDAITQFLFLQDEPALVDLCLVLGSRFAETMDPAIDLYRKGMCPRILISGHGPDEEQEKEADLFLAYALQQGVPREVLFVEREARHTRDNFELSAAVIEKEIGWPAIKTVGIVGKPYHMRRALMTARRFWPEHLNYLMFPSNLPRDLKAADWWESDWGRFRVMDELRRIGEYGAKGDLAV